MTARGSVVRKRVFWAPPRDRSLVEGGLAVARRGAGGERAAEKGDRKPLVADRGPVEGTPERMAAADEGSPVELRGCVAGEAPASRRPGELLARARIAHGSIVRVFSLAYTRRTAMETSARPSESE